MTVQSQISRITQNGDGVTVTFPVSFYFSADGDLTVIVDGVTKTITTDYSVTGAGNPAGGSVTFTTAPASGTGNVVIFRDPDLTQLLDYIENDDFPAESHERGLDKLTMIAQRINDLVSRSVRVSDSAAGTFSPLTPTTDGSLPLIGFTPGGTGIQLYPLSGTPGDASNIVYTPAGTGAVATTVNSRLQQKDSIKDRGALGDAVTLDTTPFNNEVDVVRTLGGGVFELPRGTYLVQEADLTFNNTQTVSVKGNKRGSTLTSPTVNTFAAQAKFVSGIIRRTVQEISDVRFDGNLKTTCGLSVTKRQSIIMRHLEFSENIIGLFSAGNFYYGIENPYVSENDVGMMFGNYDIGTPITGLLNGSGSPVSVTVPDPTTISGHSGNKYIRDGQARVNRIGLAFMGGNNPDIVIEKMTIEANNIGALCTGGQYRFRHCWFEANADTPGSTTLQGRTYEYAGIFAKGEGGVTPTAQVKMDGGRIEKAIIDADAALEMDDVLVVNSVTLQNGGTAVANRITGIGRAFSFLAYRPVPFTKELARFVTSFTPPKVQRIYQAQPINGVVLCTDDCTAAAFQSARLSGVNIAQTFSNVGGVFSNQTFIRTTYQANATAPRSRLRLTLDPAKVTVGQGAVVLYVMVRVSDPLFRFRMIGAQSGQMFSVADPSVSFANRANQWTPVVMVCTPNFSTIDLGAKGLLAPATVDFSGIQVVGFANKTDAQEYCAQHLFYMNEA